MTTNHIEKLDNALTRPGRIDRIITFQKTTTEVAKQMFQSFYAPKDIENPTSWAIQDYVKRKHSSCDYPSSEWELEHMASQFVEGLPEGEFSPAQLQGYLLMYKYRPDKAITNPAAWVQFAREEEAKKEQEKIQQINEDKEDVATATATAVEAKTPRRSARGRSKSVRVKSRKRA